MFEDSFFTNAELSTPQGSVPDDDLDPTLYVLYGTETGNSEYLAMDFGERAAARELVVHVAGLDNISMKQLSRARHAIFIIATASGGEMPFTAEEFWYDIIGSKAPDLHNLQYGVLALGDSAYIEYCQAGRDLDAQLEDLGAVRVLDRKECDLDYEITSEDWLSEALDVFTELMLPFQSGTADPAVSTSVARAGGRPWYSAHLDKRCVLAQDDPEREIVHYRLRIDPEADFEWHPGDALNVRVDNDPALVEDVLAELGWTGDERVPGSDKTSRALLAEEREIRLLPRNLIAAAQSRAKGAGKRDLKKLLQARDTSVMEQWRESHDLLALLREYPSVRFEPAELMGLLRHLQPRAYSIANTPLRDADQVDIVVRTVRYEADNRPFLGVVSGGLSERTAPDTTLRVQHAPNPAFRLPDDPDTDVIMVGPGVGIAPFRAFLQHRAARGDTGRNWLFCGIRDPEHDFLYGDEIQAWHEQGLLTELDVCASRAGESRSYVQHRITERDAELMKWLENGAALYVCGDASKMAGAVRLAVRSAASQALGSVHRGSLFLDQLRSERRYCQDVY
jgi:sulfite reductase (NADPH) flavoprotein alpha-component